MWRIAQEGLTNALRHSGATEVTVRLRYGAHDVEVEVVDDGHGLGAVDPRTGGHGLVGMRERAQLLGGSFHAGPGPRGGYSVSAYLPVKEDSL